MNKLKMLMAGSVLLLMFVLLPRTAYGYTSTGVVNCSGYLNVRQSPGTSAQVIGKLYPGTVISIEDSANGWYKLNYNGVTGWVSGQYVSAEAPAQTSEGAADSHILQQIAGLAQNYIGVRYVYGGTSEKGFDCSGLTQFVFGKYGIKLSRTASTQAKEGTAVSRSDLRTGDLVFFDTNGGHNNITHVGIYIGDGKFVHAESGGLRKVRISSLNEGYYSRNYMTARRVVY